MMWETLGTLAVALCLLIGGGFSLVGSIGLLKFNDSMPRLHAPTKVGTLGIGALLMASMINAYLSGGESFHELLIMAFLFVTAPITAHFIAKVHIHRRSCKTPPIPAIDETWATLDLPQDETIDLPTPEAKT